MILIFTPLARGTVRVWSTTPVLLIEFTLIFLWLFRLNNASGLSPQFKRTKLDKPIMLFLILAVTSFVFSTYKHDSFFALVRLLSYVGIFYLVLNNFNFDMFRCIFGIVICIGTGISIYGFLQYFGILNHSWWIPKEFLASTFVNHNHFAGYLELVIPMTLGILLERKKKTLVFKLGLIASLIIMTAVFIFTQSRGGWICLGISLFIMNIFLIKERRLKKSSLLLFLLISAVVLSFVYFNREEIPARIETVTNISETSIQTRIKIWQGTLMMIKDNPILGTGIGTYDWAFYRYRPTGLNIRAGYAHNEYLNMAAEMGILAPFIMLWLFALVISSALKRKTFKAQKLGCAMGILSLSLHGFVDFNFHILANMLLFTLYMAFVTLESEEKG